MRVCGWAVRALLLGGLAALGGRVSADPLPTNLEPLPRLERLDPLAVTVSGLSSGGFFAHQFHLVHARLVSGAGILAGGPYACAESVPVAGWWPGAPEPRTRAATSGCTRYVPDLFGRYLDPPGLGPALEALQGAAAAGLVDDPGLLRGHRVWLLRGREDRTVPRAVAEALRDLYLALGVPRQALAGDIDRPGIGHGIPAAGPARVACADHAPPYVLGCGFDAAEPLLAHLYGEPLQPPRGSPAELGRLIAFDQRPFAGAEPRTSMLDRGYAYIPHACAAGGPSAPRDCRLHVAFHGCNQGAGKVGDAFVTGAGYTRWAAENRIVVLFPQATEWLHDPWRFPPWSNVLANPQGCWDFWGYSAPGNAYRTREAPQVRAVRGMIDALLPAGNR